MRKAKTKINAYKRIFAQVKNYEKEVASGKVKATERKDELATQLRQFQTKKGQLALSKVRSNKRKQQFNALLEEWKVAYQPILSNKKRIRTYGKKKPFISKSNYKKLLSNMEDIRKGFSGSKDYEDESKATIARGVEEMKEFFQDELHNIFYSVSLLMEESEDISNKDALAMVFNAIIKRKDQLPDLLKQYADKDERFELIEKCLEILENADSKISEDDLIEILENANLRAASGEFVEDLIKRDEE